MQNADLTYAQDPGAVTELLSGEFFQPLGRSSSHQTWSSAMVLTPAIRGLFGLDWDAPNHALRLQPNLPAQWDSAKVRNVWVGSASFDLDFKREGEHLIIRAHSEKPQVLCLVSQDAARENCASAASTAHELRLDLPPVEIGVPHGLPEPGSQTQQFKVLDAQLAGNQLAMTLEAPGGSIQELTLRINRKGLQLSGGDVADGKLRVHFPAGEGYQRQVVSLRW
jgi:hypothetical protein